MSKNLLKSISKIVDESGSNKIMIFTNHLKIDGNIFLPEGRCEECHENFIPLENATVCRLNDYCKGEGEECQCNDFICFKYDWLNICIDEIVAFSIVQ